MVPDRKVQKNGYEINLRLILSLLFVLGFSTVIFITTMLAAADSTGIRNGVKNGTKKGDSQKLQPAAQNESDKASIFGVYLGLDEGSRQLTVYDISSRSEVLVNLNGAANIRDEYGQIIALSQIEPGSMVELSYIRDSGKLTDLSISTRAWKYAGVTNFSLEPESGIMKIAKKQYKLADNTAVLDGNDFITLHDIARQDVLTVWGYEETIWSVVVAKGHGYVKLRDYQDFLGDYISIGYESTQQITEDMMITVREGEYNLTVENVDYSATIRVRVNPNEITYVSLKELGPRAPKYGRVLFDISPFGADLFIKGELRSYANEIELPYGKYPIKVSLGGYVSYEGYLNVDSPAKTIKISLPEAESNQEVEVTESNIQGSSGSGAQGQDNNQGNGQTGGGSDLNNAGGTENGDFLVIGDKIIDTKHQIHVQKPLGASVYLNGEYMGTSPVSFSKIIGSHVITFIREGYETISYSVDVLNDGKDAYFKFDDLVPKESTEDK